MSAPLDAIDRKIVTALQRSGRASNVELAAEVHLSAPQCFRRTRALEERGVIRGYAAQVDPAALGYGVTAYVSMSIAGDQFGRVREIEREIAATSADHRMPRGVGRLRLPAEGRCARPAQPVASS